MAADSTTDGAFDLSLGEAGNTVSVTVFLKGFSLSYQQYMRSSTAESNPMQSLLTLHTAALENTQAFETVNELQYFYYSNVANISVLYRLVIVL
ncbi:hypothetical protein KIN20_018686 [Parelaphostrongylus tenuis]|uniref:Uncharacterized protein n=1 Tax=Parelaphostrongylus tenuis TaxID=148309 RepID=A0AAD5MQ98_PARTN|nr:hypothetical protein KIN20_018686 [Parelaphostrongylus tenuis]